MDEVLSAIEEAIESLTEGAVDSVRGDKGAKPTATATKSRGGYHPAFQTAFKYASGGSVNPGAYEVDDGRDLNGVKLSAARLRDQQEHEFPDVGAFGTSNLPADYDDDEDAPGREAFGRATRTGR